VGGIALLEGDEEMSKWKVYVLYYADADDPFDRCYCGKWRFQGVAYANGEDEAIRIVQGNKNLVWSLDIDTAISYGLDNADRLKRRDWAGVLWRAEKA